ncbi:hypothetical protein JAAARDRAFT_28702 [Jaapia argillacea MUCL 33604]|uniref:Anaphase-promoting complex subunit 4 WD40 domain-containing protein n=1 Tax=Jaapia argillacea MUCL 33604 TaxID=933084 RepID=A0A067QQU6_9AGAM|nr:hypothetical protein JAAARDRAFT_28702 [Jaapia argillacea MUCL 33604]
MSLTASSSLETFSSPLRSDLLPSESYVLSLASLPSSYAASASAPSNQIHLLDKSSLRNVHTFAGHNVGITCMRAIESIGGNGGPMIVSCGKDGTVKTWDDRTGSEAIRMTAAGRPRPLLSCDVSPDGLTVAGGTDLQGEDALILYWDPRHPVAPLRSHSSTHSDDITSLHFHQPSHFPQADQDMENKTVLLSASSDGLICASDANEEDEDEAVLHVGNWGCSIAQAGWVMSSDQQSPSAWASSDMETFRIWSDEMDVMRDLNIRDPSIHTANLTWVTDYLVGCYSSPRQSNLGVFVGSNEGDIALISNDDLSSPSTPWSVHRVWSTGHVGVVRSFLWDEQNNTLLTGGEDSKLNLWSCPPVIRSTPLHRDGIDVDMTDSSPSPSRKREFDSGSGRRAGGSDHGGKKARRL